MKRERNTDSDSFDMLLDAMCNTFGGIVFIALLIALLSNATSSVTREPEDAPIEPSKPVIKLLESCEACKDLLILIGKTATAISDGISEKKEEKISLENEIEKIGTTVTAGNSTIDELKEQIQAIKNRRKKTKSLRTPIETEDTDKQAVAMIIYNQKFYALHNINKPYNNSDRGADPDDTSIINITSPILAYIIRPLPGKGQPVTEGAGSRGKLNKAINNISPSKEYAQFFVHKNSFAEFIKIKKLFIDKKIEYTWSTIKVNDGAFIVTHGKAQGPQ